MLTIDLIRNPAPAQTLQERINSLFGKIEAEENEISGETPRKEAQLLTDFFCDEFGESKALSPEETAPHRTAARDLLDLAEDLPPGTGADFRTVLFALETAVQTAFRVWETPEKDPERARILEKAMRNENCGTQSMLAEKLRLQESQISAIREARCRTPRKAAAAVAKAADADPAAFGYCAPVPEAERRAAAAAIRMKTDVPAGDGKTINRNHGFLAELLAMNRRTVSNFFNGKLPADCTALRIALVCDGREKTVREIYRICGMLPQECDSTDIFVREVAASKDLTRVIGNGNAVARYFFLSLRFIVVTYCRLINWRRVYPDGGMPHRTMLTQLGLAREREVLG